MAENDWRVEVDGESAAMAITIAGIPPSPNEMRRAHWHERADQAETWRTAARLTGIDAVNRSGWAQPATAEVELVAICPTARRRDPDNFVAACKPILDGLVDAGILPDDSFAVIERLSVRHERGKHAAVQIIVAARTYRAR